jgi:hypothetical protein
VSGCAWAAIGLSVWLGCVASPASNGCAPAILDPATATCRVRTTPERISYKTMWVPGKAGSPISPPRDRRSPSPGRGLSSSSSPRQPSSSAALRAHQQHGSGSWEIDGAGRAMTQLQMGSCELIHVSAGHQPLGQGYSGGGGGGSKVPQGRRGPGLFSNSSAGTGQRVGAESPRSQWQHTLTVVQAARSLAGGVDGVRSRPASAAAALRSPRGVQSRRDLTMSADLSHQHLQDRLHPSQLAAYPGRRGQSPIGGMRYIARPASAEPQQLQRQRQQQLRGRNGNTMGLAASWDSSMWRKSPRAASPSASAGPSPRGGSSRFVAGPAWGGGSLSGRKWGGSSGYSAAAVAGGGALPSAAIACLADEVAFQDACKVSSRDASRLLCAVQRPLKNDVLWPDTLPTARLPPQNAGLPAVSAGTDGGRQLPAVCRPLSAPEHCRQAARCAPVPDQGCRQ